MKPGVEYVTLTGLSAEYALLNAVDVNRETQGLALSFHTKLQAASRNVITEELRGLFDEWSWEVRERFEEDKSLS